MTNFDPLDILMLIVFAALATPLWRALKRRRRRAKTPFSSEDQSSSEDQRIVEIAMELYRRLNVKSPPKAVVFWKGKFLPPRVTMWHPLPILRGVSPHPWYSPWSDYCFTLPAFHGPILIAPAKSMKGKLDLEEWRPLMATSFIFQFKKWKMRSKHMITRLLLPEILAVVAVLELSEIVSEPYFTVGMFTAVAAVLLFGVLFFSLSSLGRYIKKLMLMADVEAAELVGKEALLHTLRKIDDLGLEDLEKLKGTGLKARFWGWYRPSVPERIENLLTPKPAT